MDNKEKWVWLTCKRSMSSEKIASLLNKFDDIDEIYNAKEEAYGNIDLIRKSDIDNLCDKDLRYAREIIEKTEKLGAYILDFDDEKYPQSLKNISMPPYVLYVRGSLDLSRNMVGIGIVGTRDMNEYGEEVTRKLGFELARSGFTVVSGLALGVDAVAARAAIAAGGETIAVLGCGIDIDYPKTNRKLREEIEKYGAVVTEYPPGTRPIAPNFPLRNRIIAGLCECVLVTQAPKSSGALITAKYAVDMGKEVFCVPGSIFDLSCAGGNNFIKTGAMSVTSSEDITELYKSRLVSRSPREIRREIENTQPEKKGKIRKKLEEVKKKIVKPSVNDVKYNDLDETQRAILSIIIENDRISVDEIIRKTDIAPSKIGAALSLMEMLGAVRKMPGNFYEIN